MKKLLVLLFITFNLLNASEYPENFKLGVSSQNFQDCEGGALYLGFRVSKNMFIDTSYNIYYVRGVKNGTAKESWNEFDTQKLGVRYYFKSFADNQIKLFTSLGIEYMFEDKELSSEGTAVNTYGLAGVEFDASDIFSITFSMGSGGKGLNATELETSPNYGHGFISIMQIELNL